MVSLSAVADEPPQLSLQLQGIGSAITPSARLPLTGQIVDDYGVASASFQVTIDEKETVRATFTAAPDGRSEFDVDEAYEVRDLKLKAGQKVHLRGRSTGRLSPGRRGPTAHGHERTLPARCGHARDAAHDDGIARAQLAATV